MTLKAFLDDGQHGETPDGADRVLSEETIRARRTERTGVAKRNQGLGCLIEVDAL